MDKGEGEEDAVGDVRHRDQDGRHHADQLVLNRLHRIVLRHQHGLKPRLGAQKTHKEHPHKAVVPQICKITKENNNS